MITQGSQVSLEYTLATDNNEPVESNVGQQPLVYTQGHKEILPALESALIGLAVGDETQINITPEDAYGPVDPQCFREVPLETVPPEARQEGQALIAQDQAGNRLQIRVLEIRKSTALLDMNHPLAGKTLHFVVKVLDIQ